MNIATNYCAYNYRINAKNQNVSNPNFKGAVNDNLYNSVLTGSPATLPALIAKNYPKNPATKIETFQDLKNAVNPPEGAEVCALGSTGSVNEYTGIQVEVSKKCPKHCYQSAHKAYDTMGRLRSELTEDGVSIKYDKNGNVTTVGYWTEGCQYGGSTKITYDPAKGTYKKQISDPYQRTIEQGNYTPAFPVDNSAPEALPIRKKQIPSSSNSDYYSKDYYYLKNYNMTYEQANAIDD